jgi:hypothetical protein
MRIFLFAAGLLLFSVSANAQFAKGDKMVGASVGSVFINSGSSDVSFPGSTAGYSSTNKGWGIRIEPNMGWFISEKTAVGGILILNPSSQKDSYEAGGNTFQQDKTTRFNIGLGGFARNYFNDNKSMMPYGQFGFNLGINSEKAEGFDYSSDGGGSYKDSYDGESSGGFFANASLQLGITKMLGENAGLDFFAGYTYSYNKNTFKTTTLRDYGNNGSIDNTFVNEPTTKFTNHGFIVGVGFQVFLRGKKK